MGVVVWMAVCMGGAGSPGVALMEVRGGRRRGIGAGHDCPIHLGFG